MNKIVFLSMCLFSFNAAWTSSPAPIAAAASSTPSQRKQIISASVLHSKKHNIEVIKVRSESNEGAVVMNLLNSFSGKTTSFPRRTTYNADGAEIDSTNTADPDPTLIRIALDTVTASRAKLNKLQNPNDPITTNWLIIDKTIIFDGIITDKSEETAKDLKKEEHFK